MPDGCFDLIVAPQPFTDKVETAVVPLGTTVADLLTAACEDGALDPQDLPRTDVYLNGVLMEDRVAALDIRPGPGAIVNVVVMPQGGHGGEKALETALQLAVMVAAFVVAGPGGVLAGSLAGAGITGGTAVAIEAAAMATINIAGSLALASIFGNLNKPTTTDPTYNLESQSNQARQREPMPLQCGGARVALDVAASAYNTLIDNVQYITAIYGCQYGPCMITDLKIGETLASAYPSDELQIEYFLVPGVTRTTALYPNKIDQQSFQNELDPLHADFTLETTGVDPCTTFEIDLYWPSLFYTSSGGAQEDEQSKVLIQYSPHGANAWQPIPGLPAGRDKSGDASPAGTFYIVANQRNPIFKTIAFTLPNGQYDIQMSRSIRPGGDTSRDTDDVYWTALRSIDVSQPAIVDTTLSVIVLRAKASQDFDGTLGTVSAVVTSIVPKWNATTSSWDGNSAAVDSNWAASSNAAELARYMMTGYPAAFPLLDSEIDPSFGAQAALIEEMGWTGAFTQNSDGTQSEVLLKLGKLGRCTFFWDGAALHAIPDYEKPAPRQVFTGRNAKNYSYKRAFPDAVHAVWVQFTNADEDWKQDGLFVYNDGYAAVAGADVQAATLLEKLTLDYACVTNRAYTEGRVYLAKRTVLTETHQWTCGIESVASNYGDRVIVRHNSTTFGIGEGRVLFRRMSGALVAGVRLDVAVSFQDGLSYAMDARRSDQVLRGLSLTTAGGTTRDLLFGTPLAADEAPEQGDLVVIGEVNVVTEDVELIDVQPQADGTAKLTAQAYRWDDIIEAETGEIPALQSLLTTRQPAPVPTILGAQGDPNGVAVAFSIPSQRQSSIKGFSAQYRRSPSEDASSSWTTLPLLPSSANVVQTPPITQAQYQPGDTASEYRVDVQIVTVPTTGEPSQPAQALNILVQQGVLAPTNFGALGVTRTAADGSSYPAIQITCDALTVGSASILQIELQPTAPETVASEAFTPSSFSPHADNPDGDATDVQGGVTYTVRCRWHTSDGWNSDWVSQANVVVPSGALVSADAANLYGAPSEDWDALNAALLQFFSDYNDRQVVIDSRTFLNGDALPQVAQSALDQISDEITRAEGAEDTLTDSIASVSLSTDDAAAAVSAEALVRETADDSLAADITSASASFDDYTSTTDETLADLAAAGSTEAEARESLASTVGDNKASADAAILTLTDDTSAQSSDIDALEDDYAGVSAGLTTEGDTRASADDALATEQSTFSADLGTTNANLTDEEGVRATADEGLASDQDTLNVTLDGVSASVSDSEEAIVGLQGKTAASLVQGVNAGTGNATVSIASDGVTGVIELVAQILSLANSTAGGNPIPALLVAFGNVFIANKLFLGSSMTLDPATGTILLSLGSVALAIGGPFGSGDNLIIWAGPALALASMSKTNGTFWIDNAGDAYFGGSLSAGVLTTKAATPDTSASGRGRDRRIQLERRDHHRHHELRLCRVTNDTLRRHQRGLEQLQFGQGRCDARASQRRAWRRRFRPEQRRLSDHHRALQERRRQRLRARRHLEHHRQLDLDRCSPDPS